MQNIVEETRIHLAPYIGEADFSPLPFRMPSYTPPKPTFGEPENFRLIRKIPRNNYRGLDRLVPISWL